MSSIRLSYSYAELNRIAKRDPKLAAMLQQTTRRAELQEKRALCTGRGGLLNFIRLMWKVVEPSRPLVEGWILEAICEHLEAVTFGDINRLLINVPPGTSKSLCSSVFFPAWEWGPMNMPSMRYMCAAYAAHLTKRDNIRFRRLISSTEYQELWGDCFAPAADQFNILLVGNNKTGWKLATSVGGTGTGERSDRIICDDVNNPLESESSAVMETTTLWFTEVIPDRLNDLDGSAIINIQQRTNEGDVSGIILSKELDYTHLMVPMEYDPGRHCVTSIGWQDPRGLDEHGDRFSDDEMERQRGTLAWPERFTPQALSSLRSIKGEYAWCTPAESPVLMDDLSIKPIGQVREGDTVIGFETSTRPRKAGERFARRRLVRSRVLGVCESTQPVVKITLDSGRVVRCTADHKWYTKRRSDDPTHPMYKPARVGSTLYRVCDPELPRLITEEDWRDAGWLAGFFDGEGSVVFQNRREGDRSSAVISFTQGTGRNLPLCDKLERILTKFGFKFSTYEHIRTDRMLDRDEAFPQRMYIVRRSGLPVFQRFLHLIKPAKWRERLMEGALGSGFIVGKEKVVSIEPDGIETVYGLETTTGNYVVWGLASSNSGQYQQLPTPRGGGLFKREWIESWPPLNIDGTFPEDMVVSGRIQFPALEYVVGWVDTAFTDNEENDFCAMTVFGLFRAEGKGRIERRGDGTYVRVADEHGFPKVIAIYAWNKRLTIHGPPEEIPAGVSAKEWAGPRYREQRMGNWGLVEWVKDTVTRFKIDYLGIETQAAGHTLQQELHRLHADLPCSVELVPARGDKVARGYAVQGSFSSRQIYFPTYEDGSYPSWLTPLADQLFVFPKGQHDDMVDSMCGALKHLRDNFLFERRESWEAEEDRSMSYERNRRVTLPYDV